MVMKITQALLAEHVVYHCLFDHIEQVVPRTKSLVEVKALAGVLEAMLEHHSDVEDHLLIEPLMPNLSHLAQEKNLHEEHALIDGDLEQIQKARTAVVAKRLLLRAVRTSRKHFDKEERIVFPLAEKHLSAKSLELLGKRWRERRKLPTS